MKKITRKIIAAFSQRVPLKIDNSETDGTSLFLFGNKIAEWREDGLWITTAGWNTRTTRERLNGLFGVSLVNRRRVLELNGRNWDGHWVNVNAWSNAQDDTDEVVRMFMRGEFRNGVSVSTNGSILWHLGDMVASWVRDGLWITNAGDFSQERATMLSRIPGVDIEITPNGWRLNGRDWDGSSVCVGTDSNLYFESWGSAWTADVVPTNGGIQPLARVAEPEPFDVTSEWVPAGYSKPIYSVFHTNDDSCLPAVEEKLTAAGIAHRRMESDTHGKYLPNYFVVVAPDNFDNAKNLLK